MKNETDSFVYNYSAKQQDQVKRIKEKYIPKEENKYEQLRRLDKKADRKGTIYSLIVGIIGALLLGISLSIVTVFIEYFFYGVVIGIVGLAFIALAYPIFNRVTKVEREKLSPEITALCDELIENQ